MQQIETKIDRIIVRGDLYYADLTPVIGSEQGGIRPVVVIQNDMGNRYSPTIIVAAITSRNTKANLPTHVAIPRIVSGLKCDSTVLMEQVRTIDRERIREYIGHLNDSWMSRIDQSLCVSMGLNYLIANMEFPKCKAF